MTAGESADTLALLEAEPASAATHARQVIADLFTKCEIADPAQAHRLVRERLTQGEYDAYRVALEIFDGNGAIG